MNRPHICLTLLLCMAAGCGKSESPIPDQPPGPSATRAVTEAPAPRRPLVRVQPESWTLLPGDSGVQFIALPRDEVEFPRAISWRVRPEGILAIGRSGYARPIAAGTAIVEAMAEGLAVGGAEVTVAAQPVRAWDFATDILPMFTRYGCNNGTCHGREGGQNGFQLSLFGTDAAADYRAVTRDLLGRRVNLITPDRSLLLRKATGRMPHAGGMRVEEHSEAYATLLDWLRAGAPEFQGKSHGAIVDVTVEPSRIARSDPGTQQLRVVAHHADGHQKDVSPIATYRSHDDSIAVSSDDGFIALLRRGETDLVIRYGARVVPVRVGAAINPELKFDFTAISRTNVIDEQLFHRLEEVKVPPSPPADDAAFLRRVSLDLNGQQPLPEEIRAFLADSSPKRRSRKVDELIARPEFLKNWEIRFGDLLQITSARFPNGAGAYQAWLRERLRENTPWDVMVRELLTTLGNPNRQGGGAANYAIDGLDPMARAEQTAQRFLGIRLRCAQCHDHPFDIWTQDDYFGFAAFFAKAELATGPGTAMGRPEVRLDPAGVVIHKRTGMPSIPRLLQGEAPTIGASEDPRKVLAEWITRKENPYFARAMANWMWAQFFGKGLVGPIDDLSAANPPVHPALLDGLAKAFVESGYDLRALMRLIVNSAAYSLSSKPVPENADDFRLFSHHLPRPLTAHQMADAIAQATDVPNVYANRAARQGVSRAIDIFDPATPNALLDALGRCPRTVACQPSESGNPSLRQMLLLIGGETIDGKVSSLNGYLSRLLEYGAEPSDIVENLYLRTLCRLPTEAERSHWTTELASAESLQETAEDLFWALLNSREFAFNH